MLKHIVFSYSLIVFYIVCSSSITRKDYGKFTTKILRFDVCKGPKRVECGILVAKVTNDTNLLLNYSVNKDVVPTRSTIQYLAECGFEEAMSASVEALAVMLNRTTDEAQKLLEENKSSLASSLHPSALAVAQAYHLCQFA